MSYKFTDDWKKINKKLIKTAYPELKKKDIDKFLDHVIEHHLDNPIGYVDNNYCHRQIKVDLLTTIDWIDNKKLVCGGHGVFFKNHHEAVNPASKMLDTILANRAKIKKQLKVFPPESYEYAVCDRDQGNEKLTANSWYGNSGAKTSTFYNPYTAVSTTASGQSLISTTAAVIENFMSNNVKFIDLEDCMMYIYNIMDEEYEHDTSFLKNKDHDTVLQYLKGRFFEFKEDYEYPIFKVLINLSQKDLNKIYYKNNIYEFSKLRKIRMLIDDIFVKTNTFLNPNVTPKESEKEIKKLWSYYREFVFYNYFAFNRIGRLRYDLRKSIVTVDTDSNMVDLGIWVEWITDNIINVNPQLIYRERKNMVFIAVNLACYMINELYKEHLAKYCKTVNIPDDIAWRINFKNEFLFSLMILTNTKKRYMSKTLLREGVEFNKIDTKGLDFMKSSCSIPTKEFFEKLSKNKILEADNIDTAEIIRDIQEFERYIYNNLLNGDKEFLSPAKVKEIAAYKAPLQEMGVNGVMAWNTCYPDMTIQLPEIVDLVKVNMQTEEDIEDLKTSEPIIYKNIMKGIFNNTNDKIRKKGIYVMAIPRDIKKIPDWIIPYINYDAVVNDNISKFHPVLKSLELSLIQTESKAGKTYMSNIVDF